MELEPVQGEPGNAPASVDGGHRGVDRIAQILQLAAASPTGVRLTDVAGRLGAPRSSIHSLMKGLVSVDFLAERGNRYVIGSGVKRLLAPYRATSIVDLAKDEIEALSRRFNETTLLGTLIDNEVVYIFQSESTELIRYTARLGEPRKVYPTSTGKHFLAALDDETLAAFRKTLKPAERVRFDEDIELARTTGLSYNHQETVKGTIAVAAAIHGGDGSVVAAISIVGPVYRMDEERLAEIGPEVREAARRISYRLGVQEFAPPLP